jgi:DNA-binding GntR family transcriptional regulator
VIELAERPSRGSHVGAPPNYQVVVDYIKAGIASGVYLPGDKLPTIAQLADLTRTGQTAVKTALLLLNKDGIVVGRQGKGSYVADPLPPM